MVSIYIIAYNERKLLSYTLKFYQNRFPGCDITVYDNFSTDNTKQIALDHKCKVVDFYTAGKLSDETLRQIKNNCWKDAMYDWVIVVDADEWIHIQPEHLMNTTASIIRTRLCNMVNIHDDYSIRDMAKGLIYYDFLGKCVCFNKARIKEINYDYGAHECSPIGDVVFSEEKYLLLHYKYIKLDYLINRYKEFKERLSDHNKRRRLSYHYSFSRRRIKKEFNYHLRNAERIDFHRYHYD